MTNPDLQVAIAQLRADVVGWVAGLALAAAGLRVGIRVKRP